MTPKESVNIYDLELGKPYMLLLQKKEGRNPVKGVDGIEGRGFSKKRMLTRNRLDRGSNFASIRKDADLLNVILMYEGCELMNVSPSTISAKDKKLTNAQLRQQ
jgi:hypothetical protein